MRAGTLRAIVFGIGLLIPSVAVGHGGSYRGPGDVVPPNTSGPGGDVTPPGGDGTPGAGTPPLVGNPGSPSTGGPNGPGGANPARGRSSSTGGAVQRRGPTGSYDQWEFWWEHNREPFLALRERMRRGVPVSGSGAFLLGDGTNPAMLSVDRPTASDVRELLHPLFLEMMRADEADLVDSSVLALARSTRPGDAASCLGAIRDVLDHPQRTARESAALGLGVLGSSEALDVLESVVRDDELGRRLCGRPNGVEERVRAFAAAALGLIGDPSSGEVLRQVVKDPQNSTHRDLQQISLLALGLLVGDHDVIVPYLIERMQDRNIDRMVRCQAAVAIGKLHQRASELSPNASTVSHDHLFELVRVFRDDKTDLDLQRSLAQTFGMVADFGDRDTIEALEQAVQRGSDAQVRHFSMMALARIGARDSGGESSAATHAELERFFLEQLSKPSKALHVPWAALAMGVYGRSETVRIGGGSQRMGGKLLERFADQNDPSVKGAMAVALGLLSYREATQALTEEFLDSRNQPLKGYLALGLGFLGANLGERFRQELTVSGIDPKYRLQLARALGVMGDVEAVDDLVAALEKSDTLAESSSIVQALGLIGDRAALAPLVAMARDESRPSLQRGLACVALGILAEKGDLPWNAVFSVDGNYRAKTEALAEILDIL